MTRALAGHFPSGELALNGYTRFAAWAMRMLTLTLRSLERDGLVERTVTPTSPPRVDYALTPVGETLSAQVSGLITWAEQHRAYVAASRLRYDAS
ncbi:helix-turn-helix domain-containing protein [Nonomuraea sp. NPDC048882]|uniref:winged helix-turn-helix transcriptional regulator n=1 Tax=Nonomuraea sp. NPDC048882 TaxID=3154347 RepID=UPI0033C40B6E